MRCPAILPILPLLALSAAAESPLASRGYAVLPEPQRATIAAGDLRFGPAWSVERKGVAANDIAVTTLTEGLRLRFHLPAPGGAGATRIHLEIAPESVTIGEALDADKAAISAQAYRIKLAPVRVAITANAAPGLFYGVETLLQLITPRDDGSLRLPQGQIADWPDLSTRQIYWDDAHHLERPEPLREAIRQAAFYKINGFVLKLEGHFQFRSAPAVVEPYALSPAELQSLTDYALAHHVSCSLPGCSGAHRVHPEAPRIRQAARFPDSNYEGCAMNPDFYKLMEGMFHDLLDANKGVKYFYLSTDEPYYVGMAHNPQCDEASRAKELGSVGKLLAEFTTKTANWLHDRGRTVVFWGEMPLKPADIDALPPHLVNGETYGPQFDPVFAAHGIRSMIFDSTQGEERHFPEYVILPADQRLHTIRGASVGRVEGLVRKISTDPARSSAKVMERSMQGGPMPAAPRDVLAGICRRNRSRVEGRSRSAGIREGILPAVLRPARRGHGAHLPPDELAGAVLERQLGVGAVEIAKAHLGEFEQHLQSPAAGSGPVPSAASEPGAELAYSSKWGVDNARRLELAAAYLAQNDELAQLLNDNLRRADFNRYNLEVLLSIQRLCHQNLDMLAGLGRMDALLASAASSAASGQAAQAVSAADQALAVAQGIRKSRNTVLRELTATWYKNWYPRVEAANGRTFLHELDDVKDHPGDRTVDLGYEVLRETLLPLGDWVEQIRQARNRYAAAHGLPANDRVFDWKDLAAVE